MKAHALIWDSLLILQAEQGLWSTRLQPRELMGSGLLRLIREAKPGPAASRITSVRIIYYHTSDLQVAQIQDCPNGKRGSILPELAKEYPQISPTGQHAWSCQTLNPYKDAANTILSVEKVPHIQKLVDTIDRAGIRVNGVFPLMTLLEQTTAFKSPAAAIAIATTDSQAFVYERDKDGTAQAHLFEDEKASDKANKASDKALEYFSNFLTTNPDAPVAVVHATKDPWPFRSYMQQREPETLSLEALLPAAADIPASDLSNFYPPSRLPTTDQFAYAASFAAILLSAFLILSHERASANTQARNRELVQQLAQDTAQLAQRQKAKASIDAAATFDKELGKTPEGITTLIHLLDSILPKEITLSDLSTTDNSFTISGTAHGTAGAKDGPYFKFFDDLTAKGRPWTVQTKRPTTLVSGDFTISGTFQ